MLPRGYRGYVTATAISPHQLRCLAQEPPLVAGLKAPRGITVVDGNLLVAEGNAGRVISVDASGEVTPLRKALPSGRSLLPAARSTMLGSLRQ